MTSPIDAQITKFQNDLVTKKGRLNELNLAVAQARDEVIALQGAVVALEETKNLDEEQ